MRWTVYLALLGFIPATLYLFKVLPGRRAALTTLIVGYLFLPQAALSMPGMLDITPINVMSVGLVLAIAFLDSGRLSTYRFQSFDVPMAIWCLTPIASSLSNNLGIYDGVSGVVGTVLTFGVPYVVGRLYIRDADDLRALAMAVLLGGLIYIPLCWYEIRMSPQLHNLVYGFQHEGFNQSRRFGGWRPMVFLPHGLCVGMWMAVATVIAFGMWYGRKLGPVLRLPAWFIVLVLGLTTVFCKSFGAIVLMAIGIATLSVCRSLRTSVPLLILCLLVPVYLTARIAFDWNADWLIENTQEFDAERASSLDTRVTTDALLRDHALERPWFGWGGWNRVRMGNPRALTDTIWALTLGQRGLVGLFSLFGMMLLAQVLPLGRLRSGESIMHSSPELAVLVTILTLHSIDSMMNAMISPVFIAAQGALIGWGSGTNGATGSPASHGVIGRP